MKLILGCGYVGTRLARQYQAAGESVTGVVRSEQGQARLRAAGIEAARLPLGEPDVLDSLDWAGAEVFHLAPPPGEGREDGVTRALVEHFARVGDPRRLVYVSTTGVYGDCDGAWVDESQPLRPVADRAWRRLDAECVLREWRARSGGELVILRVAGIYGPDRLPLARLRSGQPLVRAEEAPYSNRIHVDDLVATCRAAMARGGDGEVYNVSDGRPSTMTEYFRAVAAAAGLARAPELPLAEAMGQLSAGMRSYMAESRRLSNRKLCESLGVELRYPDLEAGLRAALAEAS
ncbi:SDR family oxidoreductase [Marichromatium purpuratum]|uniref:SDR family oxidoreductase n=1 Tax=Marichromatium purpuratum TaxID=37487 RepID=UPI00021E6D86